MNHKRYKAVGNWTEVEAYEVTDWDDEVVATVTVLVADVEDKRTGDRYQDGVRKATVKVLGRGKRDKMFCGEMAWAECERWVRDIENEVLR